MSTFTANARPLDGMLCHEIDVNGRHTIFTDEPIELGGGDLGPAPHELVPAAIAGCVSTMVAIYARQRGWPIDGLAVDVTYNSEATPREVEVEVQLPDGLSEDQVRRIRSVAASCPVVRSLEVGFRINERIAEAVTAG